VLRVVLLNNGYRNYDLIPILLQYTNGIEVTEDTFRIAASLGRMHALRAFSKYCGMEKTSEKWLNIARLYNAAKDDDTESLTALLKIGVESDVSAPCGVTPLAEAASCGGESAVQLLLSAGAAPDGGPNLNFTPLCHAARRGRFSMVKILVEAGASIEFNDEKGNTPSMIARKEGYLRIYRYLEQCRKGREEGQ